MNSSCTRIILMGNFKNKILLYYNNMFTVLFIWTMFEPQLRIQMFRIYFFNKKMLFSMTHTAQSFSGESLYWCNWGTCNKIYKKKSQYNPSIAWSYIELNLSRIYKAATLPNLPVRDWMPIFVCNCNNQ